MPHVSFTVHYPKLPCSPFGFIYFLSGFVFTFSIAAFPEQSLLPVCVLLCTEKSNATKYFQCIGTSPHLATCDHLLSNPWRHSALNLCCGKQKKGFVEEIQRRHANCRGLWQAISTGLKLGWNQQEGGLGNASQPFEHTGTKYRLLMEARGYS